jgi:hypothetical protein
MNRRFKHRIAVSVALSAVLAVQADETHRPAESPNSTAEPSRVQTRPAEQYRRQLGSLGDYKATAERPLFTATRRPPPPRIIARAPTAAVSPVPPPAAPQLTLLAVVIAPDRRLAVFRMADGRFSRVSEGNEIDRWTVSRVLVDRVILSFQGTQKEFRFRVGQNSGANG